MRKVLLAPGEADDQNERKKWSFYTSPLQVHYIGRVFPGSVLYFPHIDSCLAIIFKLQGGSIVGGHAGMMYYFNNTSKDFGLPSLRKVLQDMKKECGGQKINQLIALGNTIGWDGDVKEEVKRQIPGVTYTIKDYDYPINVVAECELNKLALKIFKWKKDEDNHQWMFSIRPPYETINI